MWLNRGYELEDKLHMRLKLIPMSGLVLYTEKELTKLYGWMASSVDFLIETQDKMIFIQVKYLSTRRKESVKINKFLSSMRYIREHRSTKPVYGLWVSKLHPFEDNEDLLNKCNVRIVSCFESMDILIDKTLRTVISVANV